MKLKNTLRIGLFLGLFFSLLQTSINPSNSFQTLANGYYQESVYNQDVNLTVSVSNQYLTWDTDLIVNLTARGTSNELLTNSSISLEIKTVSYITFIANITRIYYLWDPRKGNVSLPNGSIEISIPILDVPTQQPYTLTAIFLNNTQTGPNVTFPIIVTSERTGFISFEGFVVMYFGAIAVVGIIWFLFRTHKIKLQLNES